MKIKDIKDLSIENLNVKLNDLRKDLIKLNAQRATGASIKNPGQLRNIKKTIARIKTVIRKKQEGGTKKT